MEKDYEGALEVFFRTSPFPSICGRVCPAFCEKACNRGRLDESIAIRALERFLSDQMERMGRISPPQEKKEKVAIIGSGPAGLTCAFHLARMGYQPTIFEALPITGGMLRTGIPPYRLPREILDREIRFIEDSGVEIKTSSPLGGDRTLSTLRNDGFKAFFLATGAQLGREIQLEGLELTGVLNGVDFLRRIELGEQIEVGKKVIIVGGGNVALDVARVAIRGWGSEHPDDLTLPADTARSALRLGHRLPGSVGRDARLRRRD
jgi:NADPH-dependent glutamate synthase beta subunit-like oxidoreductase